MDVARIDPCARCSIPLHWFDAPQTVRYSYPAAERFCLKCENALLMRPEPEYPNIQCFLSQTQYLELNNDSHTCNICGEEGPYSPKACGHTMCTRCHEKENPNNISTLKCIDCTFDECSACIVCGSEFSCREEFYLPACGHGMCMNCRCISVAQDSHFITCEKCVARRNELLQQQQPSSGNKITALSCIRCSTCECRVYSTKTNPCGHMACTICAKRGCLACDIQHKRAKQCVSCKTSTFDPVHLACSHTLCQGCFAEQEHVHDSCGECVRKYNSSDKKNKKEIIECRRCLSTVFLDQIFSTSCGHRTCMYCGVFDKDGRCKCRHCYRRAEDKMKKRDKEKEEEEVKQQQSLITSVIENVSAAESVSKKLAIACKECDEMVLGPEVMEIAEKHCHTVTCLKCLEKDTPLPMCYNDFKQVSLDDDPDMACVICMSPFDFKDRMPMKITQCCTRERYRKEQVSGERPGCGHILCETCMMSMTSDLKPCPQCRADFNETELDMNVMKKLWYQGKPGFFMDMCQKYNEASSSLEPLHAKLKKANEAVKPLEDQLKQLQKFRNDFYNEQQKASDLTQDIKRKQEELDKITAELQGLDSTCKDQKDKLKKLGDEVTQNSKVNDLLFSDLIRSRIDAVTSGTLHPSEMGLGISESQDGLSLIISVKVTRETFTVATAAKTAVDSRSNQQRWIPGKPEIFTLSYGKKKSTLTQEDVRRHAFIRRYQDAALISKDIESQAPDDLETLDADIRPGAKQGEKWLRVGSWMDRLLKTKDMASEHLFDAPLTNSNNNNNSNNNSVTTASSAYFRLVSQGAVDMARKRCITLVDRRKRAARELIELKEARAKLLRELVNSFEGCVFDNKRKCISCLKSFGGDIPPAYCETCVMFRCNKCQVDSNIHGCFGNLDSGTYGDAVIVVDDDKELTIAFRSLHIRYSILAGVDASSLKESYEVFVRFLYDFSFVCGFLDMRASDQAVIECLSIIEEHNLLKVEGASKLLRWIVPKGKKGALPIVEDNVPLLSTFGSPGQVPPLTRDFQKQYKELMDIISPPTGELRTFERAIVVLDERRTNGVDDNKTAFNLWVRLTECILHSDNQRLKNEILYLQQMHDLLSSHALGKCKEDRFQNPQYNEYVDHCIKEDGNYHIASLQRLIPAIREMGMLTKKFDQANGKGWAEHVLAEAEKKLELLRTEAVPTNWFPDYESKQKKVLAEKMGAAAASTKPEKKANEPSFVTRAQFLSMAYTFIMDLVCRETEIRNSKTGETAKEWMEKKRIEREQLLAATMKNVVDTTATGSGPKLISNQFPRAIKTGVRIADRVKKMRALQTELTGADGSGGRSSGGVVHVDPIPLSRGRNTPEIPVPRSAYVTTPAPLTTPLAVGGTIISNSNSNDVLQQHLDEMDALEEGMSHEEMVRHVQNRLEREGPGAGGAVFEANLDTIARNATNRNQEGALQHIFPLAIANTPAITEITIEDLNAIARQVGTEHTNEDIRRVLEWVATNANRPNAYNVGIDRHTNEMQRTMTRAELINNTIEVLYHGNYDSERSYRAQTTFEDVMDTNPQEDVD